MAKRAQVVEFLQENEKDFVQGNEFTDAKINRAFKIAMPDTEGMNTLAAVKAVQKFQAKKVGAQVAINKVLAGFGLYMSQKDYSNYRVRDLAETKSKIKRLKAAGRAKIRFSVKLEQGLAKNRGILRFGK